MAEGLVVMSHTEVDRLTVIQKVISKQIRQGDAAHGLGLSVRQVKRLVRRFRQEGVVGLVSRSRHRRPANALPETLRQEVLELVRTQYADFVCGFWTDACGRATRRPARLHPVPRDPTAVDDGGRAVATP